MKFSIGHRLFAAVLLAIVSVTATGIALMRHHFLAGFSSYAVQIELDRLEQLSQNLVQQYRRSGDWRFVPADAAARRAFLSDELARLQGWPVAPPMLQPPTIPAPPAAPGHLSAGFPFAPPLPPLPPPPPAPPGTGPAPDLDLLRLQDRITLYDARQRYLAGRQDDGAPAARRALVANSHTIGYLSVAQVSRPSDAISHVFLDRIGDSLLLIAAISIALSALAAILLARHFRAPIEALADGAGAVADGRYDTRIPVARSDELGQLARHFNRMAEQLGHMEASRRQWVADSSHELRTPLSVLRAQLEAMQDGVRPLDERAIAAMLGQVLSLNKLIDELYALAQSDTGQLVYQFDRLDPWEVLTDTADSFRARCDSAGLVLTLAAAPAPTTVLADRERLRQVFANLLENCIRYTAAPGRIHLGAHLEGDRLLIHIDDSAPGVPEAALARLGQRFFRVETSRSRAHGGAGLGLALCRRLIDAHGGELGFGHAPLGGLRVTVILPLAAL